MSLFAALLVSAPFSRHILKDRLSFMKRSSLNPSPSGILAFSKNHGIYQENLDSYSGGCYFYMVYDSKQPIL
jgi:hypothetical protein